MSHTQLYGVTLNTGTMFYIYIECFCVHSIVLENLFSMCVCCFGSVANLFVLMSVRIHVQLLLYDLYKNSERNERCAIDSIKKLVRHCRNIK